MGRPARRDRAHRLSSFSFAVALQSVAWRITSGQAIDFSVGLSRAWKEEQIEDWIEGEAFAALAERMALATEWTLGQILRERGEDEPSG